MTEIVSGVENAKGSPLGGSPDGSGDQLISHLVDRAETGRSLPARTCGSKA